MKKLWLTRPRADSEALARELRVPCIIAPVMQVVPVPIADLGAKPDGILLTSRHGLLAPVPKDWRDVPVYCVGAATAKAAHDCGFTNIMESEGDAPGLVRDVAANVRTGTDLLYLRGEEIRVELDALLAAKGIPVRSMVAYHALSDDTVSAELIDALRAHAVGGIVFFSPRSAALTADVIRRIGARDFVQEIDAFCLSVAVATEAGKLPWRSLKVAANPSATAMVELIHTSAIEDA